MRRQVLAGLLLTTLLVAGVPMTVRGQYAPYVYNTNTHVATPRIYMMHGSNTFYGTNVTVQGTNLLNQIVLLWSSLTTVTNATLRKDGTIPLTGTWNAGGQYITNVLLGSGAQWLGDVIASAYLPSDLSYATNYPVLAGTNISVVQTASGTRIDYTGGSVTNTNTLAQVLLAGRVASTNIGMGAFYINYAGDEGKGIFFDTVGRTHFPKDMRVYTNIVHYNDLDTMLTFSNDAVLISVGGSTYVEIASPGGQSYVKLGMLTGDIDIELNKYKVFVQGSDGYVGINTNNPLYQLDVNGTLRAQTNTWILGRLFVSNNIVLSTNHWLSGDGDFEGLQVRDNGTVYASHPFWCNSNIWMASELWVGRTYPGAATTNYVRWDVANAQVVFNIGGVAWTNKPSTGVFTNFIGGTTLTNTGVKLGAGTGIVFRVAGGTNYIDLVTNVYSWGQVVASPTNVLNSPMHGSFLLHPVIMASVKAKTGGGTCTFDIVSQYWTNDVTVYATNFTGVVATTIATNVNLGNYPLATGYVYGVVVTNVTASCTNWWYSIEYWR
jgi:hypothetical protein